MSRKNKNVCTRAAARDDVGCRKTEEHGADDEIWNSGGDAHDGQHGTETEQEHKRSGNDVDPFL